MQIHSREVSWNVLGTDIYGTLTFPENGENFPSAMAYDNFGVTAVGGDTLTLQNNLHIKNETAWYISSSDTTDCAYGDNFGDRICGDR